MMKKNRMLETDIASLQARLRQAEETLRAIQEGDVDAVIVQGTRGDQIYSLSNTINSQILENMSDAFLALDAQWRFTYINAQAEKLYRRTREELSGKIIWEAFPELQGTRFFEALYTAMETQQPVWLEEYSPAQTHWLEIRIHSSKYGLAVYYTDITERKQAEQRKDELISMISHELKTPVTGIKGFTQVLYSRFKKRDDEETLHFLSRMDAQINKLTRLINDLLDISKMNVGKLRFAEEVFDLDTLIQETVENLQAVTPTYTLRIERRARAQVFGDRDRIGQVLLNLLTNALKYSPEAEVVRIHAFCEGDHAVVSVQDFGIGIAEAHHQKIFERFYQVTDPVEKTYPGLGIGLYLSNEIISRHSGRMWVESQRGKGATFSFSLPLYRK